MNCKNCNKELILTPGRRKKEFCSNNCRVYFWNKLNKKIKANNEPEKKKRITKERNTISEVSKTTEYPLTPQEATIPPMPVRQQGEDGFDFASRKNEWKLKYNQ